MILISILFDGPFLAIFIILPNYSNNAENVITNSAKLSVCNLYSSDTHNIPFSS